MAPAARAYLERARQGSERLNAILLAMGAATRVEEAISSAERVDFDLPPLLAAPSDAYRSRSRSVRSASTPRLRRTPHDRGAPDLIMQMLDKLIENAVDFSPAQARASRCACAWNHTALIEVDNPGPPLPPRRAQGRLFESLWQLTPGARCSGRISDSASTLCG